MIVESEIEAKVVDALTTALAAVSGVKVIGSWQATNSGVVKGIEESGELARVAISVGAPEFESWTNPIANMPVAIGVTIRQELAPTAAEIAAVFGPVESLLVGWQLQTGGISSLTSLHFRVDGIRLDAGDPPQFNRTASAWTIARAFTVRGIINQ